MIQAASNAVNTTGAIKDGSRVRHRDFMSLGTVYNIQPMGSRCALVKWDRDPASSRARVCRLDELESVDGK